MAGLSWLLVWMAWQVTSEFLLCQFGRTTRYLSFALQCYSFVVNCLSRRALSIAWRWLRCNSILLDWWFHAVWFCALHSPESVWCNRWHMFVPALLLLHLVLISLALFADLLCFVLDCTDCWSDSNGRIRRRRSFPIIRWAIDNRVWFASRASVCAELINSSIGSDLSSCISASSGLLPLNVEFGWNCMRLFGLCDSQIVTLWVLSRARVSL